MTLTCFDCGKSFSLDAGDCPCPHFGAWSQENDAPANVADDAYAAWEREGRPMPFKQYLVEWLDAETFDCYLLPPDAPPIDVYDPVDDREIPW